MDIRKTGISLSRTAMLNNNFKKNIKMADNKESTGKSTIRLKITFTTTV